MLHRNSVAQTIEQKLLYVGDESGKLIAIRDMIQKVISLISSNYKFNHNCYLLWFGQTINEVSFATISGLQL